jgi:hypothetical protein
VPDQRTREVTIVAQDPSVRSRGGDILTASVQVPWEDLEPGPTGHRVQVVDYDATTQTLYRPAGASDRAFAKPDPSSILADPGFHARNAYALVMRTLHRFERALGRRVTWGFDAHQLKVVPHAFEEANAFYSRDAEALLFGYYRTRRGIVFTGLSHDIVVHETTHALLDGLRRRFMAPSSADQAAFHEAFADIVALLSVFSLRDVLGFLINRGRRSSSGLVSQDSVTFDRLAQGWLLGLADEMKPERDVGRVNALRRSVELEPKPNLLKDPEFLEPHRRGEVLAAAVMQALLLVWERRLTSLGTIRGRFLDAGRVAEEGAHIAELLLTMAIRALDYTPPVHIEFGDYLSAMLTADSEVRADDELGLRQALLDRFTAFGIKPASGRRDGLWRRPQQELVNEGVRFGSLQTDEIEMFRLIWRNRDRLRLVPTAHTHVASVRPCVRTSPDDGLPLRETVAECLQSVSITAAELDDYGLEKPQDMPDGTPVVLEGGSTLVLDEYGRLKYEIYQRLPGTGDGSGNAQRRLHYLWEHGHYGPGGSALSDLSSVHRIRAGAAAAQRDEVW